MTSSITENQVREAKTLYMEKANKLRDQEEQIANQMESQVVGNSIIRLMPNSTPDFMHIPLDFLGFCLVNIVEHGLLMPGKPNLGVFKYQEKYCVFSDQEAIDKFIADPDRYLSDVIA